MREIERIGVHPFGPAQTMPRRHAGKVTLLLR